VPNIRQTLYSQIVAALAGTPEAPRGKAQDLPTVASDLPKTWDDIGPGHLVIAQESHDNGWWEAICIRRDGDMLTFRFRDYPKLPRFSRHKAARSQRTDTPQRPDGSGPLFRFQETDK